MTSRSNKTLREHRAGSVRTAYEAGETNLTRLARRFHVSRHTVRRDLESLGVTPNPHLVRRRTGRVSVVRGVSAYGLGEHFGTIPTTSPELREAIGGLAPQTFTEAELLFGGVDGAKPHRLKPWEKRVLKLEAQVSDLTDKLNALDARFPHITWTAPLGDGMAYWTVGGAR